jgi:hypothetical protein
MQPHYWNKLSHNLQHIYIDPNGECNIPPAQAGHQELDC